MFRKGRIDPLELLKDHIVHKKSIKLKSKGTDHRLLFDNNIEFKAKTETAWKSKSGQEYTLGALWCFLDSCFIQKQDLKAYRQRAMDLDIVCVFKADNQDIIDYFSGKIDYTECINADKKASLYNKKNKDDDPEFNSQKKVKQENEKEKEPLTEKEFNLKVFDEILRFEKPISTRNKLFRVPDKSFDDILKSAQKIFSGQYVGVGDEEDLAFILGAKNQDLNKAKQIANAKLQYSVLHEYLKNKDKPIIIVPSIPEMGNLCLKNAQQFLAEGKYLDPSTLRFTNESRQIIMKISLRLTEIEMCFQIIDTPSSISDWSKVVAVFLRGSAYELKSFKEQDPSILFKKIRGYHLKFEEEKIKDQIKQWNVKVLDLHRSKRHQDIDVANVFWEDLEAFLLRPANKQ